MQLPILPFRGQKKPWASIPRINWQHPLASGLVVYGYDVGGVAIDLVAGALGSLNTATAVPRGAFRLGAGYKYAAAGGSIKLPFTKRINSVVPPVSIASAFYVTTVPASPTSFFGLGDASANQPIYVAADSGTTMRQGFNNGASDITYTVPSILNGYHTMVGVAVSTALTLTYFDGAANTTSTANPTSAFPTAIPLFNSSQIGANTLNNTTGFVPYGALWTRVLSPAEALQLHLDPYCFLIYPEDEMFATLVGTSATFNSSTTGGYNYPWSSIGRKVVIIGAG